MQGLLLLIDGRMLLQIHVPVPPSNRRDLLKQPDALFIEELNKQLGKECQNMGTCDWIILHNFQIRNTVHYLNLILNSLSKCASIRIIE